jgi:hypothetical protein
MNLLTLTGVIFGVLAGLTVRRAPDMTRRRPATFSERGRPARFEL